MKPIYSQKTINLINRTGVDLDFSNGPIESLLYRYLTRIIRHPASDIKEIERDFVNRVPEYQRNLLGKRSLAEFLAAADARIDLALRAGKKATDPLLSPRVQDKIQAHRKQLIRYSALKQEVLKESPRFSTKTSDPRREIVLNLGEKPVSDTQALVDALEEAGLTDGAVVKIQTDSSKRSGLIDLKRTMVDRGHSLIAFKGMNELLEIDPTRNPNVKIVTKAKT